MGLLERLAQEIHLVKKTMDEAKRKIRALEAKVGTPTMNMSRIEQELSYLNGVVAGGEMLLPELKSLRIAAEAKALIKRLEEASS